MKKEFEDVVLEVKIRARISFKNKTPPDLDSATYQLFIKNEVEKLGKGLESKAIEIILFAIAPKIKKPPGKLWTPPSDIKGS